MEVAHNVYYNKFDRGCNVNDLSIQKANQISLLKLVVSIIIYNPHRAHLVMPVYM